MKHTAAAIVISAALALCLSHHAARAITPGQVDDFEDGTLRNWANGGGAPAPVNITTGGPAGANDNYLRITSLGGFGGFGDAGSRLTIFNRSQWLGNYIAAGVNAIEVDLLNLGATNLSIRLAFLGALPSFSGAPAYLTAAAVLPASSGWMHFTFSLGPGNLVAIGGPAAPNTFFSSGIAEVRFINEAGATNIRGDPVAAQLGIDNIRAVPEPSATSFVALGVLFVAIEAARRRVARQSAG